MRNKQGVQLHKSAKRIAALALCCALLLTCLPTAFAAETALGTDSPQVRNLQVTRDSNGIQDVGTYGAVSENDPMYWMGQAAAGDAATLQSQENNRAMVWFGNYKQTGGWSTADKQPLVWRTMTDGTAAAAYPGKVTLMTEYVPNSVRFDDVQGSNSDPLNVWASIGSSSGSSSSLRAWMNGQGGMAPAYPARVIYGPHTDDYYETYYSNANQNGKALNFYDSAFSGWEKNLVVPTDIETEGGSKIPTADKVFALSYADLNLQALFPWGDRSRLAYGTDIACDASKTVTGYAVDSSTGYNPRQAYWWSRSPASSLSVHDVDSSGGVDGLGYVAFGWHGARPALNLDPQSVLFASASKTGGAPAVNANITNASSGSAGPRDFSEQFWRNWDGASYRVFQRSADRTALDISRIARRGNSSTAYLDISWQNGTATGPNNYLGLLAVDTATRKKYVGRVAALNAPSGSVSVKLPIPYRTQGYKVFLWNEYEDGSTRNASVDFKAYNFNEIQDGTPPTISGEGTNPNLHNWAQSKAAVCTVRKTGGDTVSRVWVSTSETDSEQGRVDMALTSGTNQNGKWQSPFVLTANGMYYVWAEDSAGNTAKEPLKVEKIDTTPPAVTVSSNPIGPTNRFVDLTVAASDVESGLAPEAYSFDGGASWQAENKKRYTENQIVQIKVRDAVGNISSVSYTISNILPPLAPGSDNPMYWMGQASEGDAATLAAQENNRAMVWFGRYKQGGDWSTTDKEPVLWRAISDGGASAAYPGRVTLLAEYAQNTTRALEYDIANPNKFSNRNTWVITYPPSPENREYSSESRAWLNGRNGMDPEYQLESFKDLNGQPPAGGDRFYGNAAYENGRQLNFYDSAFSDAEKNLIVRTLLPREDGSNTGYPGADVWDKIFLLSYDDAFGSQSAKLFPGGDSSRKAGTTKTGTWNTALHPNLTPSLQNGYIRWWLRSPAEAVGPVQREDAVCTIGYSGELISNMLCQTAQGSRPALNLDPSSVVFTAASNVGGSPAVSPMLAAASGKAPAPKPDPPYYSPSYDEGASFRVFRRTADNTALTVTNTALDAGARTFHVSYEGASASGNNYLGAMLVDTATRKKYVGRVAPITSASGSADVAFPADVPAGTYMLFLWNEYENGDVKNASASYAESFTVDFDPPAVTSTAQEPGAGAWATEKKVAATVTDALSGVAQVWYTPSAADSNAGRVDMTRTAGDGANGTWKAPVAANGTYYVWAQDANGNQTAAGMAVTVSEIDTTPPVVSVAGDPSTWTGGPVTVSVTASDAGCGLAADAYSFDGGVTWQAGVSAQFTENRTVEIRVRDVLGNTAEAAFTIGVIDTAAPDVSNISFDDQGTGTTRVTFTAEDIPKAGEQASGVRRVQWKSGADGTYADAAVDTSYADGLHYFFDAPTTALDATEYYIRAEDNAANTNEVRALDQKGTISVNAPAKMLFAVYPNTFDKQFYSPQYEVANLSETVRTKVSVVGFQETGNTDGSPNAFGLVSQGTALPENDDHIVLYMQPGGTPGAFRNFGRYNLLPDVLDEVHGLTLGTLEKKTPTGGANEQGKYTFDGDVPHYDLTKLRSTTLRAGFGMTLKFEKDNTVA